MHQLISQPSTLRGTVAPPGDKSVSHRAAIFNAIAEGTAVVENFCPGQDGVATLRCLRGLGAEITSEGGVLRITGGALHEPGDVLDAGNSGTTMRMLAGVLAGLPFVSVLTGDRSLHSRPMDRIAAPLRLMGAEISGRGERTLAPLSIRGGGLRGIEYRMPVASAQVKSALLLAGLTADGETVLEQPARSRDHTERLFAAMGVPVLEDGLTLKLRPGRLRAIDVTVPGDISSAAFWLVAGVCHPDAQVRIQGVGINPSRTGILEALEAMGASITIENRRTQGGEPVADLIARSSSLQATEIGGDLVPRLIDEVPALSLAACFAQGTTVVRDAAELRVKESDRIRTTARELSRLGARIEELPDGLRITGGAALQGATCRSYGDHRLAMTLGVAGLLAQGATTVRGAQAASVSYPSFWTDLNRLLPDEVAA